MNKEKLINHLQREIETSFMGANDRDKTIVWHCERLIKLINGGAFDGNWNGGKHGTSTK